MTTDAPRRHGRLNVKINEETAAAFNRLSTSDANATEVIRRAVALLDFITTERADGASVELVAENGSRRRLTFLY